MAATTMQSILSRPLALNVGKNMNVKASMKSQFIPTLNFPRSPRNFNISTNQRVRCMVEDGDTDQIKEQQSPVSPPQQIPTPPTPTPKVSTKLSDVLAFSGPAPERINGRLAMVGFVAAMAVELSNGQDLFAQISNGGVSWFVATSVALSLASLIPLLKGVTVESKSGVVMSSNAELWNGRLAMLGLVALAFTEYVKGGTIV